VRKKKEEKTKTKKNNGFVGNVIFMPRLDLEKNYWHTAMADRAVD